jgi:Asp-tRNA(Asn)/Glu-tRNA(Gln) amidotransferase A subunit family amidase
LRIPAEFNGLFTIKPDCRNERDANAYYGKYAAGCTIKGEPGPLTKSVRDLVTYCDFMFDKQNYKGISPKKVDPHLNLKPLDHSIW